MENKTPNSSTDDAIDNIMSKGLVGLLLFGYFGFITIPAWFRPLSTQFIFWAFALPFVLITLIVIGTRGVLGLWRAKTQNTNVDPQHKFSVWLTSLGFLWFFVSIVIANATHFAYNHQKFDTEKWKSSNWDDGSLFALSQRERMFDDLTTNVLPGLTKAEMFDQLGEPDAHYDIEGEESFIYYYGQGFIDPKCLIITFDDYDLLEEYDTSVCG